MNITQSWKKYILTLLITIAILVTVISISSWIDSKRVSEIRTIQESVSLSLLSSEIQFNLLKTADCNDLSTSDIGTELGTISDRLSYFESIGRGTDAEVISLKRYYSLLEIKDYLLVNSATKCKDRPVTVLYFYEGNCPDCSKQGDVLTYIREQYPKKFRVYSFDRSMDVPAVQTLASINKIKRPLPAIVIKDTTYNGFRSVEDIESLVPEILATTTVATSTKGRTK